MVEKNGRRTKMPVCAATGRMASSTDASTWCSFEQAVSNVARVGGSGVGFVFGPDRAYTGLDLDHVLHDGVLEPGYQWVVDAAGTYTEVSPSGDGLHLYFRGSKPDGAERCRKGPVEMYDHDRFFTVTGVPFTGCREVACKPEVVERAYRAWIEPVEDARQPTLADAAAVRGGVAGGNEGGDYTDGVDSMSDDELIDRMVRSRNGNEVKALLDGDMGAYGNDHSAADIALCNKLAFWCAGDEARMDRIFRTSGLMRDKWDSRRGGTTYGAQTIQAAVRRCTEFYRPRRRRGDSRVERRVSRQQGTSRQNTDKCSTEGAGDYTRFDFTGTMPPEVPGWRIDRRGKLFAISRDGETSVNITSNTPWVACDLDDVDTGDVRALVRVRVGKRVVERAIGRDLLMNQAKIIGVLGPMGVNVSSENARELVRYLTDCERRLCDVRPRCRSVTHLGWAEGPLGAFMPYDCGGEVRFDPSADGTVKAKPFMEPAGTLDAWVAGISAARERSMAFRCVLAASFASPLVSVLGVQTFIVYLWGRSRSGKTPTLKAAGSVWGDPTEGAEGYFRTFADTPKSIVRAATLLHDIPVIVDELQSKGAAGGGQAGKRRAVEDLLYSLSIGHERGALNADRSMMRTGSWRSLTIATGEIPIVGDNTQQGAANRTLELNAEPFGDELAAQEMHHLVGTQHGTAGRAFVDALRRNPAEFYSAQFSAVREAVVGIAGGHPQAQNIALLALADALAEYYVMGRGLEWDACLAGAMEMAAWACANATGREAGDTDLKAIQFVAEWLVRSRIHFDEGCEMDRLERWGSTEPRDDRRGTVWCVFSSVLERALTDAGFDRTKTLRRMADEGLLVLKPGQRGFTRQRRFGTRDRVYCVCIDNEALTAMLEKATEAAPEAAADLTSCGEKPC